MYPSADDIATISLPATCFPTASCLASTWDVDLLRKMGEALAEECIALNVDVLLGPGANMKRSPLGGRNFEYFSEDPFLAGEMAASLINGVQSKGVGTSLKHFAANNQEFQRFTISAEVDERTLREIYLPAFETAVKKAQPWTVMCAYNKLNGVYCSENYSPAGRHPQKRMGLRGPGRFRLGRRARPGQIAARRAGLGNARPAGAPRQSRGRGGQGRVRWTRPCWTNPCAASWASSSKPAETPKGGTFDVDAHHELARQIAAEGMVLLKNNGLLPLKDHPHIAVIGRSAENAHFQGGGSSHINPTKVAMPFKELQNQAGDGRTDLRRRLSQRITASARI